MLPQIHRELNAERKRKPWNESSWHISKFPCCVIHLHQILNQSITMSLYHYGSLNYSIMNFVIGWCVFFCLRNLWSVPTFDTDEQVNVALMLPNHLTHTLPVQVINGRRTILISSLLQDAAMNQNNRDDNVNTTETVTSQLRPTKKETKLQMLQNDRRATSKINVNNHMRRKQRSSHQYKMLSSATALPIRHTTSTVLPRSRKLTASTMSPMTRAAPVEQQSRSTILLLAFSCSFVAGGLYAKRALDRYQKWEIRSQEDSLAYDIAYTTKTEVSYGSMGSSWSDEWSKFDV
jgi:hypothetical protein